MQYHQPVLLQSVVTFLNVTSTGRYIDATIGGGGHAAAIVAAGGTVLGLDQDPEALSACPRLDRLTLLRGNFSHLADLAKQANFSSVQGILFDLGVSSHQLDTPTRGFSFQASGPLDMRMDPDLPHTAATLVNTLSPAQLEDLFRQFGEVSSASRYTRLVVSHRPYTTTDQLALHLPISIRRQVFQALRIAVNDELGALAAALPQAHQLLAPGGRICVISFHSLEDRLVKTAFSNWAAANLGTILTPTPVVPTPSEVIANRRSKSAKLRVFQAKL